MNFGEKLFKLRKEKGLSQEALADQLGTTRQAVSKWENNQGYPETEKILQLSQLFGVSTDYLLKAEKLERTADEKGYYVSREMANGFLASEKRVNRFLAWGFLCGALTGIPIILFENQPAMRLVGAAGIGALGVSALIVAMFAEQEQYKVLKEEPLLFDPEVRRTLNDEYRTFEKESDADRGAIYDSVCAGTFGAGLFRPRNFSLVVPLRVDFSGTGVRNVRFCYLTGHNRSL